jgi:hypothetical protein
MKRLGIVLIGLALVLATGSTARAEEDSRRSGDSDSRRSGYSYVRDSAGEVTVLSRYNGRVDARRNLPISTGDEILVSEAGRAEVALADGNVLFAGGGTRVRFVALRDQQGEEDQSSAINLVEGSVVVFARGENEDQIPRVDTEDATAYLQAGSRVRVNADPRRGTVVVSRAGTTEVRARAGSFRVRAGEYLQVRGDEEPEIDRGVFSRDRFDIWVADRVETVAETRSASARYVQDEYASDVATLDGYGDWQYNDEYGSDVWSPRVEAAWSPYSYGSWYYTPAGMTWWSYDPWGWYPFHYGTWFFSGSWNRWCWRPAFVYSPAWVYWAYTPSFVGWCPLGSYSYWSPWYNNYYRKLGWFNRSNAFIAIHGVFNARTVDFRGWNFVGARNFGTAVTRMDVIPGARMGDRLGSTQVAVSSRPMVVNARGGETREAVQSFVREAPRVIQRNAAADSARLGPILARQRTLPPETIEAVQQRAVVAERGRLAGPGAADVAPRGAPVDRGRSIAQIAREAPPRIDRGGPVGQASVAPAGAPPQGRGSDWRARSTQPRERGTLRSEVARPDRGNERRVEPPDARTLERGRSDRGENPPAADWRSRPRSVAPDTSASAPPAGSEATRNDGWRSRPEIPPARRVIEGAVPGRRAPEAAPETAPRGRSWRTSESDSAPPAREARPEPRPESRPREREPRPEAPPPRSERAPSYAPPPRGESARPAPAPAPRGESARPAPEPRDRGRKD